MQTYLIKTRKNLRHSLRLGAMPHILLVFGLVLIGFTSCKKDVDVPKNAVPFKAHFNAVSESLAQPTDPLQTDIAKGDGEGTPIGKASLEATLKYDLTGPSPLYVSGTSIISTSKNDKIYLKQDSYSPDPDEQGNFMVIGTMTITGGTGKYKHAKGTTNILVKGNLGDAARDVSMEGYINY